MRFGLSFDNQVGADDFRTKKNIVVSNLAYPHKTHNLPCDSQDKMPCRHEYVLYCKQIILRLMGRL